MAPVTRWAALVLTGCIVIAFAYLPPRGKASSPSRLFMSQSPQVTPARRRAQTLAEEWRATDGARRLLEWRANLRQQWSRDTIAVPGAKVILMTESAISPSKVQMVQATMDTAWRQLGLADTKVSVALILELSEPRPPTGDPAPEQDQIAYLEPDSTNRTTCLAFVPVGPYWTRFILGTQKSDQARMRTRFVQWLSAGLGPCAFYAAYGTPGRPVRQWLAARNWDVARYLDAPGINGEHFSSLNLMGDPRFSWYWEAVYSFPPATVACLAGRPSGCRAAVLTGSDRELTMTIPQVVRIERRWWRTQHLLPGERYLSDVARTVGRDRFLSFWTSSLPVDTALAAALKQPVGEWTEQWERRFVPRIRLGAAAPLGATAWALLLAAAALATVALTASRRQVR